MSNPVLRSVAHLSDVLPAGGRRHSKGMEAVDNLQSRVTRLLIADDRTRTRRALRAVLAMLPGIELIGEAADGEEAIAAVERLRPDVVILDVRMPRLDGIAATIHIKARWPEIRVIAHSLAEELRADALAAGADAFVPKGARVQELLDVLADQTGGKRAHSDFSTPSGYS